MENFEVKSQDIEINKQMFKNINKTIDFLTETATILAIESKIQNTEGLMIFIYKI